MAKIKDLEDMATAINLSCKALDHSLKEKLGIAYEVVVQWRINKVLKRIKDKDHGPEPERVDGGDPKPTRSRARKPDAQAELSLHMAGPSSNSGTQVATGGPRSTPPTPAQ